MRGERCGWRGLVEREVRVVSSTWAGMIEGREEAYEVGDVAGVAAVEVVEVVEEG